MRDPEIWDRSNGRLYAVRYGDNPAVSVDLAQSTDAELVAFHLDDNDWYVRTARRILQERGGNLSSGERQLLAVARVAIRNPNVLVMDEATAFMDPSTEATLQRDLDRLLERRTAVVIAHRLATVEAADRILVLRRGRLIEQGTHLQLRAQGGLYAELAELQERGLARL